MRELLGPLRRRGRIGRRAGLPEPEETGTTFRGECAHQGGSGGAGLWACRHSPTIQGSWSMRSTARPASIRRAGRDRSKDFAPRDGEGRSRLARARRAARRHSAPRISSRRCASPGRTATSRNSKARSTARWSGRRAARMGFGYDPMFLPDGFDHTFGEMTREEKHGLPPKGPGPSHRARAFLKLAEACLERR